MVIQIVGSVVTLVTSLALAFRQLMVSFVISEGRSSLKGHPTHLTPVLAPHLCTDKNPSDHASRSCNSIVEILRPSVHVTVHIGTFGTFEVKQSP